MACFVRARDFIVGESEFFAAVFLLRFMRPDLTSARSEGRVIPQSLGRRPRFRSVTVVSSIAPPTATRSQKAAQSFT
jgi:hypothetical protein